MTKHSKSLQHGQTQQQSKEKKAQQSQSGKNPSSTIHTHHGQGTGSITPQQRPGAGKVDPLDTDNNELAKSAAGQRSARNKRQTDQ